MTSKADALGAGRFGSRTAAPVSARRQAVAAATGVPTEGVAPPTKLPVNKISLNPDNPRSSLGDLTELAGSLLEHGQKQAITVMNRDAYVKANPAREKDLDTNATHVVIDGSSRLAAAREAGLTHLKVWVDDEQGQDSEALLESALVANIHRQDLAELDEARALERLLAIHGSQSALAKRLHKSQGWISQRLALLNLTPELQAKIGEESIKLLRAVGNKPAELQASALEELKRQRAEKESTKPRADAVPGRVAAGHYPVIAPTEETAGGAPEDDGSQRAEGQSQEVRFTAVNREPGALARGAQVAASASSAVERPDSVPEPRQQVTAQADSEEKKPPTVPFPYDNSGDAVMHLATKMSTDVFFETLRVGMKKALEMDPVRLEGIVESALGRQDTPTV